MFDVKKKLQDVLSKGWHVSLLAKTYEKIPSDVLLNRHQLNFLLKACI